MWQLPATTPDMSDTQSTPLLSDTKAALVTVAEIVTFLFAAFDGYLKLIAPPVSRVGGMYGPAAVGFASFAALLIFLYAKVWMRGAASRKGPRIWMVATGVLIVAYLAVGFRYQAVIDRHTFLFPIGQTTGTREVFGDVLTPVGKVLTGAFESTNHRAPLPAELIQGAGGGIEKTLLSIWTSRSIQDAHNSIVLWYVLFVVVLATSIACLLELMLMPGARGGPIAPDDTADAKPDDKVVKAPEGALRPLVAPPMKRELMS
jgi:hypothetical protein